jgi:ComF family protein
MSPSLVDPRRTADRLTETVKNLIFPPVCPLCRADTMVPDALCQTCWRDVAFLDGSGCKFCGYPIETGMFPDVDLICEDCTRFRKSWQRGCAVFRYEGAGRRLVLGIKHGDRLDRIPLLSRLAIRTAGTLVKEPGIVVPIPLHWRRRLKRRANQAAELGRAIAHKCPELEFAPRALLRQRNTGSQDGKDRETRNVNIDGAFSVGPQGSMLEDRRVVLIDDVLTTGATLNEAAKVCLAAGASSVDVIVLALVVRDQTAYIVPDHEELCHETS